jgi:hypothetical protein
MRRAQAVPSHSRDGSCRFSGTIRPQNARTQGERTLPGDDDDYDRIAAVTNQPTEWILPKGSLPH